MSFFSYRALTPNEPRIRLVTIHPVSDVFDPIEASSPVHASKQRAHQIADTISCSIFHASLGHVPDYTALSYTWGNAKDLRSVIVNGAVFQVTANLELALRNLRHHELPQTFWIDAMCIDQQNDIEKSEQVSQMRKIYSRAKAVLTWLGPAADNSDTAMDWIERYGHRAFELGIGSTPDLQLVNLLSAVHAETHDPSSDLMAFVQEVHDQLAPRGSTQSEVVAALAKLFNRLYWTRAWVVQEVAMATYIEFRCGVKTVREESLHHGMRLLRNFLHHAALTKTGNELTGGDGVYTRHAINLFKVRRAKGLPPLIYVLRMFRHQGASDARDKIIALLGIARDTDELGIEIDYRKTCQQVYTATARAFIEHGTLDMLSLVSQARQVPDMPSWVPDWSCALSHVPLQVRTLDRRSDPLQAKLEPPYAASGSLEQSRVIRRLQQQRWDAPVSLACIEIGIVEKLGQAWRNVDEGTWLTDIADMLSSGSSSSEAGIIEEIIRIASADQDIRRGVIVPRLGVDMVQKIAAKLQGVDLASISKQRLDDLGLNHFGMQMGRVALERRPALLSSGHVAILPARTLVGDRALIVLGSPVPYIFRSATRGALELVGECYIHDVMDGQLVDEALVKTFDIQ